METSKLLFGATMPGVQLFSSDMLWKTKFQCPDPFFLLDIPGGALIILTSRLEYERAKKESEGCDVELLVTYVSKDSKSPWYVAAFLKAHGLTRVEVSENMPVFVVENLRKRKNNIKVLVSKRALLYPERAIKSAEEVDNILQVQGVIERVLSMAVRRLKSASVASDGTLVDKNGRVMTAEGIRQFMDVEFVKRGCLATHTIIACGDQAVDPHCVGFGPLRAHLPIVFDIFPRSNKNWYWADMSRTFFKGEPSPEARKMYDTVLAAQLLAESMVKAGVNGSVIQKKVENFFEQNGYMTGIQNGAMQGFIHSVGHSLGVDIHEGPRISRLSEVLEEGCVVTVEPGLYYLGIGGVRIEDMVVVEKEGSRNLTSFTKKLDDMIIP